MNVVMLSEARARLRPAPSSPLVPCWPRFFIDLAAAAVLWGCVLAIGKVLLT